MADFEPRHVPANTEVGYTAANGEQRTLRSKPLKGDDEYHVIEPKDAADVEVLDGLEYPVARKVAARKPAGRAIRTRSPHAKASAPAAEPATDTSAKDEGD